MKTAFRALAGLIALGVVVQAAAIAYGTFASRGGADGSDAYDVHATIGMQVLPALALLLLVVAFFAGVARGVPLAAGVLVAALVAVGLAEAASDAPALGALHAVIALGVLGMSMTALERAKEPGAPAA